MSKIQVMVKNVGEPPKVETIESDYKAMQAVVGGLFDCVRLPNNIDMWVNDEGLILDLPLNLRMYYQGELYNMICGNAFFASTNDEGDTVALNDEQIEFIQKALSLECHIIRPDGLQPLYALHLQ